MAYNPEYHREYYQKNKEKKRIQGKIWAEKNREKVRQCSKENARKQRLANPEVHKERSRKWEQNNPEKVLLRAARNRAKLKGWDFNIELEDIIIPSHCPLLGIELTKRKIGHGPQDSSPSLDRINSSKGYVKGNVWIISALANRIKTNATPDQILTLALNLQKLLGKSKPKESEDV